MILRCFSQSELSRCGGILLAKDLWPIGTELSHPQYGKGKLAFRDNNGRMIFEFKPTAIGLEIVTP